MNIYEILEGTNIYHYFIGSPSKLASLSSSDDKHEARKLALQKLSPNTKNLTGKNVILVTIKNTEKNYKENSEFTCGPIAFELQNEIIKSSSQIKSGDGSTRVVYLSEKYIEKNIEDITVKLRDVVTDYKNNELNCQQGVLCMSIL